MAVEQDHPWPRTVPRVDTVVSRWGIRAFHGLAVTDEHLRDNARPIFQQTPYQNMGEDTTTALKQEHLSSWTFQMVNEAVVMYVYALSL